MPTGSRRFLAWPRSTQCSDTRLRPPPAGCADRRSAFQAVPALLLGWLYAVPPTSGGLCRPEVGVPSRPRASSRLAVRRSAHLRRAVPTGGRRSKPSPRFFSVGCTPFRPPPADCADRRSAFQAVPALLLGRLYAVPPTSGGLCRPEVGVPSRPRASSRSAVRRSAHLRRAVPTGGRRSKPSPRLFAGGHTRFRCAARHRAGLKTGAPPPA